MQGSLLEPGAGSGYRGLGTRGWEASLLGQLSSDASASFYPLQSSPLCCHGHPHMGPSPPPSLSPDALPFSQCPPHTTRVPKTQFQMSGRVDQFGHRRGPRLSPISCGCCLGAHTGQTVSSVRTGPSCPHCRTPSHKDRAGPQQGLRKGPFLEEHLLPLSSSCVPGHGGAVSERASCLHFVRSQVK